MPNILLILPNAIVSLIILAFGIALAVDTFPFQPALLGTIVPAIAGFAVAIAGAASPKFRIRALLLSSLITGLLFLPAWYGLDHWSSHNMDDGLAWGVCVVGPSFLGIGVGVITAVIGFVVAKHAKQVGSHCQACRPDVASAGSGVCSQCGRPFGNDDLIDFRGLLLCAQCKPLFFQRIGERARPPVGLGDMGTARYGGFWLRFEARLVDSLVLACSYFLIVGVVGAVARAGVGADDMETIVIVLTVPILPLVYHAFMIGTWGMTLGKMGCGLKVVLAGGGKITYARALGRAAATFLSDWTLLIGYIMAGFDREKRALHDRISNTRVVRR